MEINFDSSCTFIANASIRRNCGAQTVCGGSELTICGLRRNVISTTRFPLNNSNKAEP